MICCAVDCGPCAGICRENRVELSMTNKPQTYGCPAFCNPSEHIDKGLCSGCKTFRPNRLSKKQERRAKVEERKRSRFT